MTYIRVPVPRLDAGLVSNLLLLLGAMALVAAPGGLTHNWWWSVVALGVVSTATGYLVAVQEPREGESVEVPVTARLRSTQ